jgi:hypothetical protein
LLLVAVVLVTGACGSKSKTSQPAPTRDTPAPSRGLSYYDGPPPWPLAGEQLARMQAAGLEGYTAEGSFVHYHAHLDVFYDGQRVTVPPNLGIDIPKQRIAPMHTHAPSGVIHIEANSDADFTLGQFLSEWGVKVKDGCIADKCGDEIAVFVNGSIQDTPAAALVIKPRKEIALVLGTRPPDIPSTYDCKAEDPGDLCPQA